jgi:hypothetical protein
MTLLIGKTTHKYITALTTPYPGYAVVIPHPSVVGAQVRKNFFGVERTQEHYLQAAIAWRDRVYRRLYGGDLPQRSFHRQQANSNTSLPGISRVVKTVKKTLAGGMVATYLVPCIVAQVCTVPGANYQRARGFKSKVYSINKYGEAEAQRLATEWRARMIAELAGATAPPLRA